jgi:rifampicin phosphotransferase
MAKFGRTHPRAVIPLTDLTNAIGRRDTQVGVLGRAMAAVDGLGVVVPETWVVVADLFRHVVGVALPAGHDPGSLLRLIQRPVGAERAARAREKLLTVVLENDIEREIDAAFRALGEAAPWGLAVRASPLLADEGVARAASLSHTELGVMNREDLGRAIRKIWAMAASESSLGYLRGRKYRDLSMAVLIQPVVVAHASAALVTDVRPSVSGEVSSKASRLVVAHQGLGNRGVDVARAQMIRFDEDGTEHGQRMATIGQRLVVKQGTLRWVDAVKAEPVSDSRISELAEIARRLDSLGPTELRCVIPPEGDVTIVDARAAYHSGYPGSGSAQTLWARAWAADVPAEPLTPLSRRLLARPTLERLQRTLGSRAPRAGRLASAVTDIDGRIYVSLSPFFEEAPSNEFLDAKAQVELIGAQWAPELDRSPSPRASVARAVIRLAQIATEQRVLTDAVARFERDAEQERRWLAEMDLAILPDDALTTTLDEVRGFLEGAHRLHGDATAAVVGCHALLASVLSSVDDARASWLAHVVTSAADVVTARPAFAFSSVAAIASLDPAGRAWLETGRLESFSADLPEGPLRRAMLEYLSAFGDRGLAEAELSSPRWSEDATPVFRMLRVATRGAPADADAAQTRARALADRALTLLEARLSFFESRFVRDLVARQRELLRLRERCRARIAHALKMMRTVALDVDRRIRRLDPTLDPQAVVFLSLDELGSAVKKSRDDLAPLVRARRADFAAKGGVPSPTPVFRGVVPAAYPGLQDQLLSGAAASPGTAEGRAVRLGPRLEGLDTFAPGDVLVVRSLDLGLSPLFSYASAVVSELGTALSSSALVARECAVPLVTSLPNAWMRIRDGQTLRVDGDAGTVECFES